MLAFITTLRHPQNSADYGRVESLLQDTLASLTQQTCEDYIVIVVGNRRPTFPLPDSTVFVEVDFPPPSARTGPRTGAASVIWDKGTKNAVGLIAARDFEPEYVMFVDADDFVHRKLAEFVHARPGHAGWVVKRGLMYSRRRNAYRRLRNFYRFCGTSFIIPSGAYEVPTHLTVSATQQDIAEAFGERLEHVLEHGWAFDWWRKHGRILEPLPFAGAVYHLQNGENHSDNALFGPALPYRSHL
ncbi:MAG: glycosyltransferase family A protein, partial [Mycobacterium sp.]